MSTQPAPVIESVQQFMDEMFNYLGHPLSPDALKQDLRVAEENEECKEDLEEIELLADSYFSGSKPPKITTISCSRGGNPFGPQLSSWVLLQERYVEKLTPNIIKLPDAQGQEIRIQVPRVAVLEAL